MLAELCYISRNVILAQFLCITLVKFCYTVYIMLAQLQLH